MNYNLIWIFLLILHNFATPTPLPNQYDLGVIGIVREVKSKSPQTPTTTDSKSSDEKVISVRITSSVAVGRGKGDSQVRIQPAHIINHDFGRPSTQDFFGPTQSTTISNNEGIHETEVTNEPQNLIGANIEYIKQLNAKKELRERVESMHPFQSMVITQNDRVDEILHREFSARIEKYEDDNKDIPLARKVSSTADANRFLVEKSNQRYQGSDINLNIQMNITNDALFESAVQFGMNPADNVNKDAMSSTTVATMIEHNKRSDSKDTRHSDDSMGIDTFNSNSKNYHHDDSVAESSIKSVEYTKYNEEIGNISPTATIRPAVSSFNYQGLTNMPMDEKLNNPRLTTVSFNIVHEPSNTNGDNEPSNSHVASSQVVPKQQFYDPPKIYSQPSQMYSEPAKFYSEPSKVYSEPAKIYSEPAKVYSEPAKIYSEPSKFYSEPASLHLNQNVQPSVAPNYSPWQRQPQGPARSTVMTTTPLSTVTNSFDLDNTQMDHQPEHQPEKNYEVDEKISVLTDGRSHGVQQQETSTEKCKQDNCKVGYVVEGRQFKKYRVEERTPDGFIVGEYGVVRNEDGALRGVRYTADSDASPRLIHDALMKFLQLQ